MPIEMKILWVEKAVARGWNNKTFKIYDSDRHDFWFQNKTIAFHHNSSFSCKLKSCCPSKPPEVRAVLVTQAVLYGHWETLMKKRDQTFFAWTFAASTTGRPKFPILTSVGSQILAEDVSFYMRHWLLEYDKKLQNGYFKGGYAHHFSKNASG